MVGHQHAERAFKWAPFRRWLELGWEGGWCAANVRCSDSNPGLLQRGQGLCRQDAHPYQLSCPSGHICCIFIGGILCVKKKRSPGRDKCAHFTVLLLLVFFSGSREMLNSAQGIWSRTTISAGKWEPAYIIVKLSHNGLNLLMDFPLASLWARITSGELLICSERKVYTD